jgi:DNA-binding NarL/FixJ family response regulator
VIVGRASLLSSLDQALDAAEGGRASTLLLLGDPGMGKTVVIDEVRRAAVRRGWSVVVAAAPEASPEVAFALVQDVVHDLLARAGRLAAGEHEALARILDPRRWQVQPVATALRDLLLDAAGQRPVLVLIDDLHWADDDSVSAVALAAARIAGERVAIMATAWPSMGTDPRLLAWSHVHLGPLVEADAVAVLQSVVSFPLDPEQASRVARSLGHCPSALVECERLLSPAQIIGSDPLPELVPVGERLRHEWGLVVAGLPEATRQALLAVSVLDASYPAPMHGVLTAVGCTERDLEPAVRHGLLVPGRRGTLTTADALVRAAVLDAHEPGDIQAMHRLVADTAIRLESPPAVAIYHLRRSASLGDASVVAKLESQAERARDRGQPEVEARAWQAAAELTEDADARATRAVRAARVWLSEATTVEGAEPLLALLNETRLDSADTVWREWTRAEVLAGTNLADSAAAALLAAEHAESTQPTLVPWLLWDAAATSWMADDPDLALLAATRLMAWSTSGAMVEPAHVPGWLASAVLGAAYLHAGRTRDGADLVRVARSASNGWRADSSTPLSQLVNVVALDELLLADGTHQRARVQDLLGRLADDRGNTRSSVLTIQGWRSYRRGDWAAARSHAMEAIELACAVRAPTEERSALMLLALMESAYAHVSGDTEAARSPGDVVARLRHQASQVGDSRAWAAADRADGLEALVAGRIGDATVALQRACGARCRGRGVTDAPLAATVDLVEASVRAGDIGTATAVAGRALGTLSELSSLDPDAAALGARVRALVANGNDADAAFDRAVAAHDVGHDEFEAARTRMLRGEHLRRTRRPSAARQDLLTAAVQFDRLGATAWGQRARREARPGRRGQREHDPSWRTRLTAQEQRVALEVSRGATNAEVGAVLTLSPRTVECHLASAYRKLGVRNRVELADLVRAAGQ